MASFDIRDTITGSNYGPILSIISWILMVVMILSVGTKIAMKILSSHSFGLDDSVLLLAMVTTRSAVCQRKGRANSDECLVIEHWANHRV